MKSIEAKRAPPSGALSAPVQRMKEEGELSLGMHDVDGAAFGLQAMPPLQWAAAVQRLQQTKGNGFVARVQAKMTVGPAGDSYEQEADRIAERVMRMPDSQPVQHRAPPEDLQRKPVSGQITRISRQVEPEEPEEGEIQLKGPDGGFAVPQAVESRLEARRGGGQPLPAPVRGFMEPRFGADFSDLRLHSDSEAVQLAEGLGARAFTRGQDIYMGRGQDPRTDSGERLIAHELTHVVQQGASTVVRRAKKPWTMWFSKKRKAVNALEKAIKGNNITTVNAKAAELLVMGKLRFYLKLMEYELDKHSGDPAKWLNTFFSLQNAYGTDPLTIHMLQANAEKLDHMSTEMANHIAKRFVGGLKNKSRRLELIQIPELTRALKSKCTDIIWKELVGKTPILSILEGAKAVQSSSPTTSTAAFAQADLIFHGFLTGGQIPLSYKGTHAGQDTSKIYTTRSRVNIETDCHHLAAILKNVFLAWPGHPKAIPNSEEKPILTSQLSTMARTEIGLIAGNYSGNVLKYDTTTTSYVPANQIFFSAGLGTSTHSWVELEYNGRKRSYDPVFGTVGNQVVASISERFNREKGIFKGNTNIIIPVNMLKQTVQALLPTIPTQYGITSRYLMVPSGQEKTVM